MAVSLVEVSMSVFELVQKEPWRTGQGQPRSILDPLWRAEELCDGTIEWEGNTPWWWCTKCGFCGMHTFTEHRPIEEPTTFFLKGVADFMHRAAARGLDPMTAIGQALYVAGMALRYAAANGAVDLKSFVERLRTH
jgi:hypothetical protein